MSEPALHDANDQRARLEIWEKRWNQQHEGLKWAGRACPVEIVSDILDANGFLPKGGSVVDVGCGLGEIAAWFSEHGYRVDAVDISPSAISRARSKRESGVNFLVRDVVTQGLPTTYDIVVDRGCFHGIPPSLQTTYASRIVEGTNTGGFLCLFIRAFRDEGPIDLREELAAHCRLVAKFFCPRFTLLSCRFSDLSPPKKPASLPGLYFLLRKRV